MASPLLPGEVLELPRRMPPWLRSVGRLARGVLLITGAGLAVYVVLLGCRIARPIVLLLTGNN